MRDWRRLLIDRAASGPVVMVTVIDTVGSTPREIGARMLVHARGVDGSIGGGQLEYQEIAVARALLAHHAMSWRRETRRIILGPDAGQCCGGVVEVLHEVLAAREVAMLVSAGDNGWFERAIESGVAGSCRPACAGGNSGGVRPDTGGTAYAGVRICVANDKRAICDALTPSRVALNIYGAGHVARALVRVLQELPFDIAWIDAAAERFPDGQRAGDVRMIVGDPVAYAGDAAAGVRHLVMTHDHDLDAAICLAILGHNSFGWLGLIGSATKRARFVQRFRRAGIAEAALSRLVCPIGLPMVAGKAPAMIAVSVAAQLIAELSNEARPPSSAHA